VALTVLLAAVLAAADPVPGHAAASAWSQSEQGRVRLLTAGDTVGSKTEVRAGLQFKLQPGWKIYWRSPGDAGYPPHLDWSKSGNLASADMSWPVPHRFSLFGFETFGYADEVVLPITLKAEDPAQPLHLRANLNYLTCEEVCVPVRTALSLDLPAGPDQPSRNGFLIDQYAAQVPAKDGGHGLGLQRVALVGTDDAPRLEVKVRSEVPLKAPDLLVEGPEGFVFGPPDVTLDEGGRSALMVAAVDRTAAAKGELDGRQVTLTVTDGQRGLEKTVRVARLGASASQAGEASSGGIDLLAALGLALLGGLILNLMPCVLPVLSLKLLAVVGHGGGEARHVRVGFVASAAGILVSFLGLAGVAIALRNAGLAAGWGIQFQQPLFLTAMLLVLTLFACNLMGFFEIPLPRWAGGLGNIGYRHEATGHGGHHGIGGHFLTGMFATLLATPCSAPFLGTAVGFALARGTVEILLIFTALGLGLAAPYLLVAAVPALATRLPKPGHWMVTLRRILGLALAATAVWLLTVLANQEGWLAAGLAVAALLAIAAVLAWRPGRLVGRAAVAVLAAVLVAAPLLTRHAPPSPAPVDGWVVLDPSRISDEVAAGKLVFVDVTADWCITCQANKRLVLDRDDVRRQLDGTDVVRMRGDWTLPDDAIATYLASYDRYGIPFNAVYGPRAPDGIVLPELLNTQAVLDAVERARDG
jgi:suppressor for copper-sensitivity B